MVKASKTELFLELAMPNEYGCSREVLVDEFSGKYERLKFGNGGDWCRSDGSLAKEYIVKRYHKNGETGPIISIRLHGFNTKHKINKQIREDIAKEIKRGKCSVLCVSNVEVDHKDGHRDDFSKITPEAQKLEDFQPLASSVNKAKRQHCKECRDTRLRFDAKQLGFARSFFTGENEYVGSCVGCYWHDPKKFNYEMSKGSGRQKR
jgi:hypothetical protein